MTVKPYVDPRGLFTIVPPTGWSIHEYPEDVRGKAQFSSPAGDESFRILAQISDYHSFDELEENTHTRSTEIKTIARSVVVEKLVLSGAPAMKVTAEAGDLLQIQFLFLRGAVYYNIAFDFHKGEPNALRIHEVLETFRATPTTSNALAKEHSLNAKLRRARLMIDRGHWELAQGALTEAFELVPGNAQAASLQRELDAKRRDE